MRDYLDLQLGEITKVNTNEGTIDIKGFRTGGSVYRNVPIEQPAGDSYQPVVGQHVLFFTYAVPNTKSQWIVKIIRFYSSLTADRDLTLSSPIDLAAGERRLVSQRGDMLYVSNDGILLAGMGQSLSIDDQTQLTKLLANKLQIITRGGFLISAQNGTITIQKGEVRPDGAQYQVTNPTLTLTITGQTLDISGDNVTINTNCKEVKLNGNTPVAREGDEVEVELSLVPTPNTPVPQGTTLATSIVSPVGPCTWVPDATVTLKGRITGGSSKVKAG